MGGQLAFRSHVLTDKAVETEKRRIRKHILPWIKRMGLMWWSIDILYSISDQSDAYQDGKGKASATVSVDWQYLRAGITFYLPLTTNLKDDELDSVCCHECCHILVNILRGKDFSIDHEELACTMLENAFGWTFEAGRQAGVKEARREKR